MRNSSINRSNLSDEKMAFLEELKDKNEKELDSSQESDSNGPKAYKRTEKDKENGRELDFLWQGLKNSKDDKSPGIYLLTGFIAGALCVFVMNSVFSIGANTQMENPNTAVMGQPKFEKKIMRREKMPQIVSENDQPVQVQPIPADIEQESPQSAAEKRAPEKYIVKSGDSIGTIVSRFYGKYDPEKIERIKQANNLKSVHRLSIGQELIIPFD